MYAISLHGSKSEYLADLERMFWWGLGLRLGSGLGPGSGLGLGMGFGLGSGLGLGLELGSRLRLEFARDDSRGTRACSAQPYPNPALPLPYP